MSKREVFGSLILIAVASSALLMFYPSYVKCVIDDHAQRQAMEDYMRIAYGYDVKVSTETNGQRWCFESHRHGRSRWVESDGTVCTVYHAGTTGAVSLDVGDFEPYPVRYVERRIVMNQYAGTSTLFVAHGGPVKVKEITKDGESVRVYYLANPGASLQ